MYRHCVYCAATLGGNEAVEEFPVGRRLAFDAARGRLWVVCRRCERWNLSPLEERWEALESLERLYRDTRTRVSTENIGLARLMEGLELVRVGAPRRPEFAAWRYGDQFGRRRRRFLVGAGVALGVGGGIAAGSAAIAGLSATVLPLHLFNLYNIARNKGKPRTFLHTADGERIPVPPEMVGMQRVRPSDDPAGWQLILSPPGETERILTGRDAVHALSILMPKVNRTGASSGDVRKAVAQIESAGSPDRFFARVEHTARARGLGYNPIRGLPRPLRLALEMSAHEEQERAALEGELELLERAWREAEEIAAIADDLAITDRVRRRLRELKATAGDESSATG